MRCGSLQTASHLMRGGGGDGWMWDMEEDSPGESVEERRAPEGAKGHNWQQQGAGTGGDAGRVLGGGEPAAGRMGRGAA